jgi:uncharacterized protein
MNKALSLTGLPARLVAVPFDTVNGDWFVIVNPLAGSLIGAWISATWATRTPYRVLAVLLVLIAVARLEPLWRPRPAPPGSRSADPVGASGRRRHWHHGRLDGCRRGRAAHPYVVLLFAVNIKITGSLALAISLPTMLVAFARYSRDRSFKVLRANKGFLLAMAAGSIIGTILGGLLRCAVPEDALIPLLVALLLASSVKVWRHD